MIIQNLLRLAIIPTIITISSCNSFLDVVPKGVVIPQTLEDYEALLSAPLVVATTSNNTIYATDEIILPEAHRAGASGYPGRHAVNTYDFLPEHYDVSENDADWNKAYTAIYTYNTVLQGLVDNKEVDITKKNRLKGEALVHRAFTYLSLVNQYANHYSSKSKTDLGVPLALKPDINALLERSSVDAVYQQVEQDLLDAIPLLPKQSTFSYKPSKAAAMGTLARMYLYQSKWEQAYDYANQALTINSFLYDYNTFSYTDPNNRRSAVKGYPTIQHEKKHLILYKYLQKVGALDFQFLFSNDQYTLFQTGDLREYFGSSPKGYSPTPLPGFGVLEMGATYDYNNGGLTTQEMYLIRSEAAARLGNIDIALNDLNYLRQRRFATNVYKPIVANSKSEAIEFIRNERRIELAFYGLRLADIKRYHLEGLQTIIKRGDKVIDSSSPLLVFPIPAKNISINPNLIQNPR